MNGSERISRGGVVRIQFCRGLTDNRRPLRLNFRRCRKFGWRCHLEHSLAAKAYRAWHKSYRHVLIGRVHASTGSYHQTNVDYVVPASIEEGIPWAHSFHYSLKWVTVRRNTPIAVASYIFESAWLVWQETMWTLTVAECRALQGASTNFDIKFNRRQ